MPSIKVLESNKNSTPESFNNAVESGGNDGYSSAKEAQQTPTIMNAVASNNGNGKEQPANPLQQIVLIIEHKIRNLEKRKNKLESYKAIEKSGKKLTGDQKIAVSKYDECLTSLELTRELCKQFQSIAAAANKEAKKEAKRGAFVRAQQENAKIREVLVIQDVLKRLSNDSVRDDFRNGENGACKIADEDLILLEKLYEETQPKRPETTAEPTFLVAIKHAADHLSAVVDGRNKGFGNSTYMHIKAIIAEVQSCGYFEKDILEVEEEEEDEEDAAHQSSENEHSTENDIPDDEVKMEESTNPDSTEEQKVLGSAYTAKPLPPLSNVTDVVHPHIFLEAPAAAAVPTPTFPTQPIVVRQNSVPSSAIPIEGAVNNSSLMTSTIQMPAPVIGSNVGIIPQNTANVQPAAIIVPSGSATVPVIQSSATSLHPVTGPQIGATTVQAVEHAYFKQHYIQQQMRPIHEVIGTGNFFFLQESEIDKPDGISTPVNFGSAIQSSNSVTTSTQQPQQQQQQTQIILTQTNNPPYLQSGSQQVLASHHTPNNSTPHQASTISAQSSTFGNHAFQNIAASANTFNKPQLVEQRQPSQISHTAQHAHTKPPSVLKSNELGHIPGFTSCNTTVVSTQSVLPNAQSSQPTQQQQPQQHKAPQGPTQVQRQVNQKNQQTQPKPSSTCTGQQGTILNSSYNPSIQQFPSLIHDAPSQGTNKITQKLTNVTVVSTSETVKSAMPEKLAMNQPSHLSQSSQHAKQRNDEWNRGADFVNTVASTDDDWSKAPVPINNTMEENSQEKGQYGLSRQSQHQQHVTASNTASISGTSIAGNTNRIQQNGNSPSNYGANCPVQDLSGTQPPQNSIQQLHQAGNRNTRSASNSQFHQNNGSNARFSNDNGVNNPAPTFFKNNERFYQQNQSNSLISNKTDPTYHQRSSMFKSRPESNSNPASRSSGYGTIVGNNASSVPNNNNGSMSANMDYRSNARPVNSTRNTGPPSSRPQQRNHSGNGNYGGPRGGSNTRGQPSINA